MIKIIIGKKPKWEKVLDKDLNLYETQELIKSLDESTKIQANCNIGSYKKEFKDKTPSETYNFINDKFNPKQLTDVYFEANHKVWLKGSIENHQLYTAQGCIEAKFGDEMIKGIPYREATFEYSISQKNPDQPQSKLEKKIGYQ